MCLLHIFFSVYDLSSHILDIVFCRAEVFNFNEVQVISYFFMGHALGVVFEKSSSFLRSLGFLWYLLGVL